jgi:hypothetical protein
MVQLDGDWARRQRLLNEQRVSSEIFRQNNVSRFHVIGLTVGILSSFSTDST